MSIIGEECYEREIRAHVEPQHNGKTLVLDVESGDYEIATTAIEGIRRLKSEHSKPVLYILRIGHQTA